MTTDIDDEELTFEDGPIENGADQPQVEKAPEAAPEGTAQAEAAAQEEAAAEAPPLPSPKDSPQAAATDPAPRKRSATGMAVAAGFAVCILASTVSAVQSWRAATAATAGASHDTQQLTARLHSMERLLQQQRDTLDELVTRPAVLAAANTSAADGASQINALAAAVRANQEMTERLAARVNTRAAPPARPAASPAPWRKTSSAKPVKPAAASGQAAMKSPAKPAPAANDVDALKASQAAMRKQIDDLNSRMNQRPAGEAIRYP